MASVDFTPRVSQLEFTRLKVEEMKTHLSELDQMIRVKKNAGQDVALDVQQYQKLKFDIERWDAALKQEGI